MSKPREAGWRGRRGAFLLGVPLVAAALLAPRGPSPVARPSQGLVRPVPREQVRAADLLFRRGRGLLTQAVLAVESSSAYSHVGVVVVRPAGLFVVHSVPDEPPGDPGSVRAEPLETFTAPERAEALGLYRVQKLAGDTPRRVAALAEGAALRRLPFDPDFDLASQDRVYCTEFVWRIFRDAGGLDLLAGPPPLMSFALQRRRVITPSALIESEALHAVWTSP